MGRKSWGLQRRIGLGEKYQKLKTEERTSGQDIWPKSVVL